MNHLHLVSIKCFVKLSFVKITKFGKFKRNYGCKRFWYLSNHKTHLKASMLVYTKIKMFIHNISHNLFS